MTDQEKHEKLQEIQSLVRKRRIVFAPQNKVNDPLLAPFIKKVLQVIAPKGAFISDESTIGDFVSHLGDKDKRQGKLRDWQKELSLEFNFKDYIADVAIKLRRTSDESQTAQTPTSTAYEGLRRVDPKAGGS